MDLGEFDGHPVLGTAIAVRNAGDGLSAALKVDPTVMHSGDTIYVALECQVADITFKPIPDASAFVRSHVLKAGTATIVDPDLVADLLTAQADRIRAAREHEAGVRRMFDKTAEQLLDEHAIGDHPDPVPGCEACLAQWPADTPDTPDTPEPTT